MGSVGDIRPQAVTVSLHELENNSVSLETLEQAFGPDSLGIIIVKDLPAQFIELRRNLLSLASYLANLPAEELAKVEKPEAKYDVGWSCGKETLADGRYDTLKGSYYAQPIHDATLEAKARQLYPGVVSFVTPNVWPEQSVLPGFEAAFEALCHLIVDTAGLVARSCDRYGEARLDGYRAGTLERIVRTSVSTKARLLHYFPPPATTASATAGNKAADEGKGAAIDDDWCATHHDLGALTGLTSQMFVDEGADPPIVRGAGAVTPLPELDGHPDPKAGLWIKDRAGRTTQVHIPRDCLAFQTGEALQLITRGKFRAVPHFVRGGDASKGGKIARNTLAVFTQPNLWDVVDETTGRDFANLAQVTLDGNL
ncbi:Clavaminate synthase-like protein [Polychaeton citri CBS 116435]|uniref:Clavaminate synthase-like protein n=1 Tax=Polychaeton citri CBS 116435 TaxID=1314669 RepID=A0A9P4Q8B9_9PEZI|nr:Clavaminate synthase-like protein [Polychaeton citri CBS 116435]